jgi:hypothetical protein
MHDIFEILHGFYGFFKVFIKFFELVVLSIIFLYFLHHGVSNHGNGISQGTKGKGISHNIIFAFHILHWLTKIKLL